MMGLMELMSYVGSEYMFGSSYGLDINKLRVVIQRKGFKGKRASRMDPGQGPIRVSTEVPRAPSCFTAMELKRKASSGRGPICVSTEVPQASSCFTAMELKRKASSGEVQFVYQQKLK